MYISAVKRLIAINRIQNKSFCLHNICAYCVYLLCIYKYKHMHVYILETYVIFIYNINVYTCKYFQKYILYVCVFIYT